MELEGRFNPTMTVPDVLQFLSLGKMTGTLHIERGTELVSLSVRRGKLVGSSRADQPRRLTQTIISRGIAPRMVAEDEYEQFKAAGSEGSFAAFLGERRVLSDDDIRRAAALQFEEDVYGLFTVQDGSFKFERDTEDGVANAVAEMDIEPVIMEGTRRLDEWVGITRNIPSDKMVPHLQMSDGHVDRRQHNFSEREWRVLALVNGFYDVGSICMRSGLGEFQAYSVLSSLVDEGRITLLAPETELSASGATADSPEVQADFDGFPPSPPADTAASSTRIVALFRRRAERTAPPVEPPAPTAPIQPESPAPFPNAVAFVVEAADRVLVRLAASNDFSLGQADARLAEDLWRTQLMNFPLADLVVALDNTLAADRFNRYHELAGSSPAFKHLHAETIECLSRFLRTLFRIAAQRIGQRTAQQIFSSSFDDLRQSVTITNADDFFFQEYTSRIYG